MKKFLALSLSYVAFIMLINVKMPTTVGILTFMSMISFVLNWVEHGKSFKTSGSDQTFTWIVGPSAALLVYIDYNL